MTRKITRVWECPTNDGTKLFEVGEWVREYSHEHGRWVGCDWMVGRIEDDGYPEGRVSIYDTDNVLRVSLPASACGVEWGESGR